MDLNKKNIVLIGMMGSWKSTIGYLLSKSIDLKFIDIDKLIEKEIGLKIHNIFEKKGEAYFRNLEEKITLKFLKSKRKNISLGGGGFLNRNIRKETLINGVSFWLNWKSTTIIKRICKSKKRPLAFNINENDLKKIIIQRSKTYSEANFKINCDNMNKKDVVQKILNLYAKN